ncbi:MAG: hypothetical protein HY686_08015 [Chloroflexi bacterium]|nr:hypothetical protein [Chloroflexota bacterium]
MQQLRQLRPHLVYLFLALVLGLADLLLLVGASGVVGQGPSRVDQERRLRQISQQTEAARGGIATEQFPKVGGVENLVLSLASLAQKSEVRITGFSTITKPEALAGRPMMVVENNMEVRGAIGGLVAFLDQVRTATVETHEVTSVSLRQEGRTWVLQLLIRVYAEP